MLGFSAYKHVKSESGENLRFEAKAVLLSLVLHTISLICK